MKISQTQYRKVSFKRQLTPEEQQKYNSVLKEAQQKSGRNGKSVLIVHDACLPRCAAEDIGAGNLNTKKSGEFFDFMKNYLNINAVEVLPPGEMSPLKNGKFYCAYSASALSLGQHQINLQLLTSPEYDSILTHEEFKKVVNANKLQSKDRIVNYENVVPAGSPFDKALNQAFKRFQASSNLENLKNEFQTYKKQNEDWLEPKILFSALEKEYGHSDWQNWEELDKNLLDIKSDETKNRIAFLKDKYKEDSEFYRFKQFLADKHLSQGRNALNKKGIKLIGDCLAGFSQDEYWAYKKAFNFDYSIGWGIPAYNYENITDPQSQAAKLLKKKVQIFAKRYDSIRFDVSWAYVQPKLYPKPHMNGKPYEKNVNFESQILDMIENYVKEVKGTDFDVKNLIHEFDAGPEDFQACYGNKWRDALQNRTKALGTTYMNPGWGSNNVYLDLNNQNPNFVLGAGNHDPQALKQIAYGIPDIDGRIHKTAQIQPLADLFRLQQPEILNNPVEFVKYKFAEIMTAKHNQYFYMDVFGRDDRFDSQGNNGYLNYRQAIPENFPKAYIKSVEEGFGFNPMDAMEKVFRMKNLDKQEPELYNQIVHFRDILLEKTPQAQKSFLSKNKYLIGAAAIIGAIYAGFKTLNKKPKIQALKPFNNENVKPVFKNFIR